MSTIAFALVAALMAVCTAQLPGAILDSNCTAVDTNWCDAILSPNQPAAYVFRLNATAGQMMSLTSVAFSGKVHRSGMSRVRISLYPARSTSAPYIQPGAELVAAAEFDGPFNTTIFNLANESSWVSPYSPFVVGSHVAQLWAIAITWLPSTNSFCTMPCKGTIAPPIGYQGVQFVAALTGTSFQPLTWTVANFRHAISLVASPIQVAPSPTMSMTPTPTPSVTPSSSSIGFGGPFLILDNTAQQSASVSSSVYVDASPKGYSFTMTDLSAYWNLRQLSLSICSMGNVTRNMIFTFTLYTTDSNGFVMSPNNNASIVATGNLTLTVSPYDMPLSTPGISLFQQLDLADTGVNFLLNPRISRNYALVWKSATGDTNWGYRGVVMDIKPTQGRSWIMGDFLTQTNGPSGPAYTRQSSLFAVCWLRGARWAMPTMTPSFSATSVPTSMATGDPTSVPNSFTPTSTATPTSAPIGSIAMTMKLRAAPYSMLSMYTDRIVNATQNDIAQYFALNISWPRPATQAITVELNADYWDQSTASSLYIRLPIPPRMINSLNAALILMRAMFSLDPYVANVFASTVATVSQIIGNATSGRVGNNTTPGPPALVNITCSNLPYSEGTYSRSPLPASSPVPLTPTTAVVVPIIFRGMSYSLLSSGTIGFTRLQAGLRSDFANIFSQLGVLIDSNNVAISVSAYAGMRRALVADAVDQASDADVAAGRQLQVNSGVTVIATIPFAEPAPNTAPVIASALQAAIVNGGAGVFLSAVYVYNTQISSGGTATISASVAPGGVTVDASQANVNGGSGGAAGSSSGSGVGGIVGGVIGALILLAIIGALIYLLVVMPQQQRRRNEEAAAKKGASGGTTVIFAQPNTGGAQIQMTPMGGQGGTTIIMAGGSQQQPVSMVNPMAAKRMSMNPAGAPDGMPPGQHPYSGYAPTPVASSGV